MANELISLFVVNANAEVAIVDKNLCAFAKVGHEAWIAYSNNFACGWLFGTANNAHNVALVKLNGLLGLSGTHFGTFGINKNSYVA